MNREELLELLRQTGGTRQSTVRVLGDVVTSDDMVYEQEVVETETPEGIRTVQWYSTRRCSCGRAIDQNNALTGVCTSCGQTVCAADGCSHRCRRCGRVICRRHACVYGEETYCRRHSWVHWVKLLFA